MFAYFQVLVILPGVADVITNKFTKNVLKFEDASVKDQILGSNCIRAHGGCNKVQRVFEIVKA